MSDTKASAKAKRELAVEADALLAFAHHEVSSRSTDRVLLQRRYRDGGWDDHYAVELVKVRGGLLVSGDISHVLFAYHRSETLESALGWLKCRLACGYVAEKARIGMRLDGSVQSISHARVAYAHAAILRALVLLDGDLDRPAEGDVEGACSAPSTAANVHNERARLRAENAELRRRDSAFRSKRRDGSGAP